jgi:membrane associated rhomboid family serine protease
MRLWHLVFAVAIVSVVMTLVRDDAGRVAVIVFVFGVGECALGVAALMALFQTVGALGEARGLIAHAAAIAATTLVLASASTIMVAWLFAGAWLVGASLG